MEQLFLWILILGFLIYSTLGNKKEIDAGKADDISTFDYWGNPSSNKEDYFGGKLAIAIFIIIGILILLE